MAAVRRNRRPCSPSLVCERRPIGLLAEQPPVPTGQRSPWSVDGAGWDADASQLPYSRQPRRSLHVSVIFQRGSFDRHPDPLSSPPPFRCSGGDCSRLRICWEGRAAAYLCAGFTFAAVLLWEVTTLACITFSLRASFPLFRRKQYFSETIW